MAHRCSPQVRHTGAAHRHGTQVQPTGAAKRLRPASPSLLSREIFQTPRKNREESCPQLPSRKQGSEGFFLATVVIPES